MSDIPRIGIGVKEAAEVLGCSVAHVWDLIREGEISSSKSGRKRLVDYSSLVEHFEKGRVA